MRLLLPVKEPKEPLLVLLRLPSEQARSMEKLIQLKKRIQQPSGMHFLWRLVRRPALKVKEEVEVVAVVVRGVGLWRQRRTLHLHLGSF